jgi:low temperature requirement protein LtrA
MDRQRINIWWGPPRKFTIQQSERKISWLELFYDLVYVIVIARITHILAAHTDWRGLNDFFYLFLMAFWGWANGSQYHELHGSPGIRTRFMTLWQMMAVAYISRFAE